MNYTFTTTPAEPAAGRPAPIDHALVAEARRLLAETVAGFPPGASLDRHGMQTLFARPMMALCDVSSPKAIPIEKLIVAIKLAWASMTEARLSLGDAAPEALSAAVTACIEAYFHSAGRVLAD